MHETTNLIKFQLADKLRDKEYREAFIAESLSSTIAAQIHALRQARHKTQVELGELVGMGQGRISLLENPEYDGYSIKTLERLAVALDAGLVVELVSLDKLIDWNISAADCARAIPKLNDQIVSLLAYGSPDSNVISITRPTEGQSVCQLNAAENQSLWSSRLVTNAPRPMNGSEEKQPKNNSGLAMVA